MAEPEPELVTQMDVRVKSQQTPSPTSQPTLETRLNGEEQALESHEVIELQTFSDRKAWIEEKIKFLESLPPIEVFAGLEDIKSSSESVSGLPTRLELQRWVTEHDAIEKETEIFDTGELTKLRQLTKAATQRNLSPEDTDVIELTLTTIYELDKLLHLLRDRSEHLEMMDIRLTWEENRQNSWTERRQIIEDLETFCVNRARWNPTIYDNPNIIAEDPHTLTRRSSIASLASAGSDNAINSAAFSRGARFKLAEILSRDAAQFSGRVTALRHGKVAIAGKALDKLIDHSRKPVPEELLDEQDRLEEKSIGEMENISKFTMNMVMQWRKADEIYVETMKDQTTASNLLEEIETAKLYHPTARQSASFASRIDTILKRLAIRGDPSSPASTFPRPEHFLLPEQKIANDKLISDLSGDIENANRLARKVELAAKDYRVSYEAVKRAENTQASMVDITSTLSSILSRLKDGIFGGDGDGSPPNPTIERCLDPSAHSLFLAFLPSLRESLRTSLATADAILRSAPSILLGLQVQGIDVQFKERVAFDLRRLTTLREEVASNNDLISQRVMRLREARKLSSAIDSNFTSLKDFRLQLIESMKQEHWQQQYNRAGELDAPRSPVTPYTPSLGRYLTNLEDVGRQLLQMDSKINVEVVEPLNVFSASSKDGLVTYFKNEVSTLLKAMEVNTYLMRLLGAIREQTTVMKSIQHEAHEILGRIEHSKVEIHSRIERALSHSPSDIEPQMFEQDVEFKTVEQQVTDFNNNLAHRVLFVDRPLSPHLSNLPDSNILPFDLASLDAAVRAHLNSYTMKLNGAIESLKNEQKHLQLVKITKLADSALITAQNEIDAMTQELASKKVYFETITRDSTEGINSLQALSDVMIIFRAKSSEIAESLNPIHEVLQKMDVISTQLDLVIRETLYLARHRLLTNCERQIRDCDIEASRFHSTLSNAVNDAQKLQEVMAAAEAIRREQEEMRLATEEVERKKLEEKRVQDEEEKRLLEVRVAEENRKEEERQRLEIELAEQRRIVEETAEAERLALEELARQAEVTRVQAESHRLLKEEAEKIRVEKERAEIIQKLREAETQLEEERRLHAEHNAAALDLEREMHFQMDLQRKHSEAQRLVEEQEHQRLVEEILKRQADEKQRLIDAEEARRISELEEVERRKPNHLEQVDAETRPPAEQHAFSDKDLDDHGAKIDEYLERSMAVENPEDRILSSQEVALAQQNTENNCPAKEPVHTASVHTTQIESLNGVQEQDPPRHDKPAADLQQGKGSKVNGEKLHRRDQKQHRTTLPKTVLEPPGNTPSVKEGKKIQRPVYDPAMSEEPDVFGNPTPNLSTLTKEPEHAELRAELMALRKRLRSIGIDIALHPSKSSTTLPTVSQFKKMYTQLTALSADFQKASSNAEAVEISAEVEYLKSDIDSAFTSLNEIEKLAALHESIQTCDAALSDLLEHIDSYPAAPLSTLTSHQSISSDLPEDQLSSRLEFTRTVVAGMANKATNAVEDSRTRSEHSRIQQTWVELEEMANDRLSGNKSRPNSSVSRSNSRSSLNDGASIPIPLPRPTYKASAKKHSYANLSISSASSVKGKMLAPPAPSSKSRRTASGTTETTSRSTSRMSSVSSNRSVSGPLSASVYGSTFASRQRTTSLTVPNATSSRPPTTSSSRFRITSESKRVQSPSMSEKSALSQSRSSLAPSRSSISSSTWSRAPRDSLSSILQRPRVVTPQKKADLHVRKKYVANPKSKLDMAVGDVVNQLPVGINVEGITETWRDQSGKYWIGNQDPKLCFCRILRSQTVMVRVGGGWTELSKFIKDHFADSFKIGPESPRMSSQEKWISSATLLEQEIPTSLPRAPQTPEPILPFVPSFSLMTPSGQSPHSLKSSPSAKGSPLTPLQFMRRADPEHPSTTLLRPVTPSKTPLRGRTSNANTPSRTSVWRP